jgi:hypothetical protein
MSTLHQIAIDVLVEESELSEGPDHYADASQWPAWTDQVQYEIDGPVVPDDEEMTEASEMFGELQDEIDILEFEQWIDDLTSTRYFQIRSAIEVIRSALADYREDLSMTRLLRAIHPV